MNQVQSWAEQRIESLGILVGQEVSGLDLSDDRLESVIFNLSKDESWNSFEQDLSQRQLQVYDLKPERVRLDSTSVSGFWDENKEGLFRYGHSKDRRPDLPQMKLMMATLDPLGLPIASEIVAGNSADDPLYEPAIAQVRKTLVQRGMLYVGDCKMGSISTRNFIEHCFGRLKGQPLSLRPMFLQREDHIKGLMRLLSIGLRLLTLVEFQVKRALAVTKRKLDGIYSGNPRRATAQPTTERLLASFKEITIVRLSRS